MEFSSPSPARGGRALGLLLMLAGTGLLVYAVATSGRTEPNPDPNHTHADFAVWVSGKQIDFSAEQFMSGSSTDATHEGARHPYFHLHDGNGSVVHRHKPGLGIGEFFQSLGFAMTADCLTTVSGIPHCSDSAQRWRFFVNGEERPMDPAYVFDDLDQLLWVYGPPDADVSEQLRQLSDDACRYSRTCPGRGAPPTENCIADPAVPCLE